MTWQPEVGQVVRAKITMINDLTADGMGRQICANQDDILVVRTVYSGHSNCISVSHEHITYKSFCCSIEEIELLAPEGGDK